MDSHTCLTKRRKLFTSQSCQFIYQLPKIILNSKKSMGKVHISLILKPNKDKNQLHHHHSVFPVKHWHQGGFFRFLHHVLANCVKRKKSMFLKLSQCFMERTIHSDSRAVAGTSAMHCTQAGFLTPLSNPSFCLLCLHSLGKLLPGQHVC